MTGLPATPRTTRARTRYAAVAAFVALAPLLPGAAAAVGPQEVDAELPYVCAFPSGKQPVKVRVRATFPAQARTGEEIRPVKVSTAVELPAAATAELTGLKAATAQPATRLSVTASQGAEEAPASWPGSAQPVAVPAEGPLELSTTGDVPAVSTASAGPLVFTAGALDLDLALALADGAAATPPSLSVTCALDPKASGGDGKLVTVPVGEDTGTTSPSPGGSPSHSEPGGTGTTAPGKPGTSPSPGKGPKAKAKGPSVRAAAPKRDAPPCIKKNPTDVSLNAYITGYANVRKQKGASLIPVSCVQIEQGPPELVFPPDGSPLHLVQTSPGYLDYQGRKQTPPFKSTFLTFDFVPATATMVLEQTGPMVVSSDVLLSFPDNIAETYVRVPLKIHVLDVKVNGTRLDVGPNCRTATSLKSADPDPAKYPGDHLVMLGKGKLVNGTDATGYVLTSGGPLTGEVTIPAFKGCGSKGENLDRLLTASISGPGNYIKQIQGQTCKVIEDVPTENQCTEDREPYVVPKPER
ncbi:DUF6801 domain-containing protein [Streptomyces sp. NPDC001941]|uniref:DUF6801 domain-containing protein n=1 Tax=Streptomyces sp. NPDC001941 TaxID=3154659 RepID=UPI003319DBC5